MRSNGERHVPKTRFSTPRGISAGVALLALFTVACDEKDTSSSTGGTVLNGGDVEGLEVLYRQPSRASAELAVGLGAVWSHGYGNDAEGSRLFLRWSSQSPEPQEAGPWDGDTLAPRIAVTDTEVFRLNGGSFERHGPDGASSGSFPAATAGRLTQIAAGVDHIVASSQSCAEIAALDKRTGEVRTLSNDVPLLVGGGWGLVATSDSIFCTGNDYLARVDLGTMTLTRWRETEDVTSGIEAIHYGPMLHLANKIFVLVTADGPARVVELNQDTLEEGPQLALPDFHTFSRWYPDDENTGFYANFLSLTDEASRIVHVNVATGAVRQLTPNRPLREHDIGPGFGMDDEYIYWVEFTNGEKVIVRYPRGKFDEPYDPQ